MTSSRNARVCRFSRIGPIALRMAVVVPDKPTRNTYFSQISRTMSVESSALMPPFRQACRKASARVDRRPSNSPKTRRSIGPVCRMTPGRSIVVATRSEEHTSELQSQSNLVCRLLLEKKKKKHLDFYTKTTKKKKKK